MSLAAICTPVWPVADAAAGQIFPSRRRHARHPHQSVGVSALLAVAIPSQTRIACPHSPSVDLGLDEPVAKRGPLTVPLDDGGVGIASLYQLEQGQDEIHVQVPRLVEMRQRGRGHPFLVPVVPDEAAYTRTNHPLDPRLAILPAISKTGELNATLGAIVDQRLVDERVAIARVYAKDGEGQALVDGFQSLNNPGPLPWPGGEQLQSSRCGHRWLPVRG